MKSNTTNSATTSKLRLGVAFAAVGAMIASATTVVGAPQPELTAESVGILETSWAGLTDPEPSFDLGDGTGAGFGALEPAPVDYGGTLLDPSDGFGAGAYTIDRTDSFAEAYSTPRAYTAEDSSDGYGGNAVTDKPTETEAPVLVDRSVITLPMLTDDLFGRRYNIEAGQGVDIALIDTGVAPVDGLDDPDHVLHGPDLSAEGAWQETAHLDTYGHGTHMAGIIGGNRSGAEGVAPGSRIISLKVAGQDGTTTVPQVVAAIDWVIEHRNSDGLNIRVLNLSLGQDDVKTHVGDPLSAAVERAWQAGIVVVVAAGNDGTTSDHLDAPAIDPYVIAVGASDSTTSPFARDGRSVPDWSQGGTERTPDIVAPGTSIASYRVPGSTVDVAAASGRYGDDLFLGSGTSQAAAVTTGIAAILIANNPNLTPDRVKATIERRSWDLPDVSAARQGDGHVNGRSAYRRPVRRATQSFPTAAGQGTGIIAPTDSTWSGGTWSGSTWSGGTWSGSTWSGSTWSGSTWSGSTWSGGTWSGSTWSGGTWSGGTWSGGTWSGSGWS